MKFKNVSLVLCLLGAVATAVGASEVWNSKDPSQWTSDDIHQILNKSPWAKETQASANGADQAEGAKTHRGHFPASIGFPGGGGGYPGGGGGYPGGGGGYPGGGRGGGGYPGGGGRGGPVGQDGGNPREQSTPVVVRWESGLPVQQALDQSGLHGEAEEDRKNQARKGGNAKPDATQTGPNQNAQPDSKLESRADADEHPAAELANSKTYVISIVGLHLPIASEDDGDTRDNNAHAEDQASGPRLRSSSAVREELMERTKLVRAGREPITPSDVKLDTGKWPNEIHFYFSRTSDPVSLDDKEVTFQTQLGSLKVTEKFHPKDMKYKGKLAL